MPVIKCKGVNVEFPFEPYDCQNDYMSKVIECLQSGTNGILESPTGTGKTLCLLCATLAWRNTYISQQELGRCLQGADKEASSAEGSEGSFRQKLASDLKEGAGDSWEDDQQGTFMDRPRIIYASRTHSQLSQAVDQLKNTAYRPRVAVLGSREQLCVHPEVQKAETHMAKVHMCRAKVNSRMCNFYNNVDQKKADKAFTDSILDIEDLVTLGNTHKVCPYYMAKELKTNADIIFMPYNYLLDVRARRAHGVELQGNIVIFDEAHNVEKMCEESASFDLTSYDLASCVEETDHLLKKTVEVEMCNQGFRADSDGDGDFDTSALATLKKVFLDLETEINNIAPPKDGITKPGGFIYELFAKVHITFETKVEILQLLEKIISHLTTSSTIFHNKAAGLEKFCEIINIIFSKETSSGSVEDSGRFYKVHIHPSQQQRKGGRTDLWTSNNPTKAKKQGYTLSYWCFCPGFTMKDLVAQGVRSIILTSGTLSPLNSFKSELQIDFPIQLENPHVIGSHQMTVAVMTKGPDNTVLNSSYQTRFNIDYIMSLGNAIVNFARLVPNGLLVFFPSYPVMNNSLEQWQETGIRNRISQYKEVFVEPRGKVDFAQTIEAFYEKINDPKLNGACFFAVCRGKVSEGLDFADMNGRAVVITGLPYPPRMDAKIQLKMKYLDESRRRNKTALTGQEWYCQQASRAVNQAIGRVIRHKEDFGAILLCDKRFSHRDTRNQLPSWVRPYVNVYEQFGKGIRDLTTFFRETEKLMPKPKVKQARSSAPVLINQSQCHQQPVSAPTSSSLPPVVKATQFDMHVPSLKRNRDGSHVSEAQLKIMYEDSRPPPAKKATGLLNALSSVENTSLDQDEGFLSQRSTQAKNEQSALLRRLDDQKKKKKIVIKQQNGRHSVETKTTSEPSKPDPKKEPRSRVEMFMLPAQQYIDEVKRTLSADSYKAFTNILRSYKKNDNFLTTTSELADLFITYDESRYHLFRNFYTFARAPHKKNFDKICTDLTGVGCGYKPEHSVPPKLKRIKESPSANTLSRNKTEPHRVEVNQPINPTVSAKGSLPGHTSHSSKRHKFDAETLGTSDMTASLSHSNEMCIVNHLQETSLAKIPNRQLAPGVSKTTHAGGSDYKKHLPSEVGSHVQSKKSALLIDQKEGTESVQCNLASRSCHQFLQNSDTEDLQSGEPQPIGTIHLHETLSSLTSQSKNQGDGKLEAKDHDGTNRIKSAFMSSPRVPGVLGDNSNQGKRSEEVDLLEKSHETLSVNLSEPQNATIPPVSLGESQPNLVKELKTGQRHEQERSSQTLNQEGVDLNGKNCQVIDEEEPMSLESSFGEVDVLDASKDLFDDSFGQPNLLRGTDVLNLESSSSKDCPSTMQKKEPEDTNLQHQKLVEDELQVGTRSRQDSDLASPTRSDLPRFQKMALLMERSINETREDGNRVDLEDQREKRAIEEEDKVKEQSVNKKQHNSKHLTSKKKSYNKGMCLFSGPCEGKADGCSIESGSSSSGKRTGLLAEVDNRKTNKKENATSRSPLPKQGFLKKSKKTPEKQRSLMKPVDKTKSKKTPEKHRSLMKPVDKTKSKKTPEKHGSLIKPEEHPKCLTPSKRRSETSDNSLMMWQSLTHTPTKVAKSKTPSKKKSLKSPGTPQSVSKHQAREGKSSDSRTTSDERRKENGLDTPKHKHRRRDGETGKATRVHSNSTKDGKDNLKAKFKITDGLLQHTFGDKTSPGKRWKTPSPKTKVKKSNHVKPGENFQASLQESESTSSQDKKAKSKMLKALFKEQSKPQTDEELNCSHEVL